MLQQYQNQQQSQVPQSQRQSRRSSSNFNLKDDISSQSNKGEFTQGSTFGIYDQKSDNLINNSLNSQQENQGKMLFQNIQIDQADQSKNAALIKSRQQSSSENNSNNQQSQTTDQIRVIIDSQQKALDQTTNSSQGSQNIVNAVGQEYLKRFENESQEQQLSKNNKLCNAISKDIKANYDQHFLSQTQVLENQESSNNQQINKYSQQQEVVDFKMDIEETDNQLQQKQLIENYGEEEECQQYDNENKEEELDEEENQFAYKKGKFLKKSKKPSNDINTNVKTRSKLGNKTTNKKDQKNNKAQNNIQKAENSKINTTQTHSKTAGKGEAYFNRTYRGNNNTTHGGLSKMNTSGNEIANAVIKDEIVEQNKAENLDTLVNSLQFQRQSSQQLFSSDTQKPCQSYLAQLSFQNKQQNISDNQQTYNKENDCSNKIDNKQYNQDAQRNQQQINLVPTFQQSGRKYLKRVIDKIVLDFRSNQDLQQQSLKELAITLNDLFSQVNELHLKIPDNQDWNNLITLEFSTCMPIVLDVRIDPICFQKVAFTNMNKEIQTAFRKLKFGDRLKDNPNTQQIQEEIQNWFCPEKDFVCKKSLVKENYLQSQEINQNLEQLEFENYRYQQIFFKSSLHSFCSICQNQASEQHYLQANTQGLYFCYSQKDILIQDFIEFLDKVQINLQNQYSQIFNEGEIRENLCSNQQLYLFQHFKNREFTNYNGDQAIRDFKLQQISEQKIQNKSEDDFIQTPVQTKNPNQLPQSMNRNSQSQEQYLNYSTPVTQPFKFQNSNFYQEQQLQKQFQINSMNNNKINHHMQSYYVSQEDFKYNNFHKKLERALKLKLIESVTIRFCFQEYYYEEQYELVQKIYNIIKIISQRININKLYLSVNQGISPLILSQIIFVEELNIDLIEAGSCLKDKNVFYLNLRKPKYQILKHDLQIFAQIVNQNASFEEIHINFDEKQKTCIQSISHLLTRYRQEINLKEQTLTIFRENLPPIQEFPSSVCEYLDIIDESGNFNDKEVEQEEEETDLVSNKYSQSPEIYNKYSNYDDLGQEENSVDSQNSSEKNILDTKQENDQFIQNIHCLSEKNPFDSVIDSNKNNIIINLIQNEQNNIEVQKLSQNNISLQLKEVEEQTPKFISSQIETEKQSQKIEVEEQLIEQESQQVETDVTQNLSVSKKRERKRQPKKKADLNLEQKQSISEKAISKKRNQDKDEKRQQKSKNQKVNAKQKKGKDNEQTIKNLNSENEQDQKSSSINEQQDDESKEALTNLETNQINSPNNSNNSTNSKGDQYLNIKGKQQILKQDQNPQQLLY
ncbi:hypothetical protein TTHERM_00145290 (macronuclear) [Tetrahymena thermophila SB210]|uniref:Uncharacterized protein n=1 Tax=Tetrahymena thermophila (strain SB210) TaxID=312017 RepID=I7M7B6_TETTS|nr:hypothetical protein TTHERM_00145290 [Tetrahymena thermophila SB210]EAR90924.2 hypothetical protein TTHERM_00145290 [Tetrahymena thermophila SB210]|eukprot:XP_001011169.2 hypothetical protein TTHERM_00145290 [Tetrahymena thermophila SB210]